MVLEKITKYVYNRDYVSSSPYYLLAMVWRSTKILMVYRSTKIKLIHILAVCIGLLLL